MKIQKGNIRQQKTVDRQYNHFSLIIIVQNLPVLVEKIKLLLTW